MAEHLTRPRVSQDTSKPLKFQVLEFVCDDSEIASDDTAPRRDAEARFQTRIATIYAFGVTEKGVSVCATVTGFVPFFFIELADGTDLVKFHQIINKIGSKVSEYHRANIRLRDCMIVSRTSFYGFQNEKKRLFGCLRFRTFATCKSVYYHLSREGKVATFEGKLDQLFKFLHIQRFESWVELPANKYVPAGNSRTQIDVEVASIFFQPCNEARIAPLMQCTVDIETYSSRSTERELEQCDPKNPNDVCFQIASAFKTFGSGVGKFEMKHIIVVGPCDTWDEELMEDEGGRRRTVVKRCRTETEALLAWAKLIESTDPDILYSWNGDYFDFHYMVTRAIALKIDVPFLKSVSRLVNKPAEMEETSFSSKAHGTSDFRRLHMFGRINADVLPYMRKEFKHRLYKLGYIAEQYGIGEKDNVTVNMIFASFREQDPAKIAEVAKYCIQDTLLPQLLVDKLKILPNLIELSRATFVPVRYLLHRGQQIRILCLLSRHTRDAGMLIPDIKELEETEVEGDVVQGDGGGSEVEEETDDEDDQGIQVDEAAGEPEAKSIDTFQRLKRKAPEAARSTTVKKPKKSKKGYQGATVLPPKAGAYYQPITTLDFASLYPSIMRSDNLCYSTFVMDERTITGIPNDEDHIFTINDENGKFSYKFVTEKVRAGILPTLLANLAQLRKEAKKDLAKELSKEEPDEFLCSILDARQLSKKLIMNSCYGFLATPSLPCKQISETVTAVGRRMINRTKAFIYEKWGGDLTHQDPAKRGADVIYGDTDSVFVDFNLDPLKYPTMKERFEFATKAAAEITRTCFKPPHNLEFEKIYQPLFMLMKKRYFGLKYTRYDKPPVVDNRGVVIQRRDVCPFVQETFTACRDMVLYNETVTGGLNALAYLDTALKDLVGENVDLEKCAITKTYTKDYTDPMKIPHAAVAMKMRENGEDVCKGDKIQYVYARRRWLKRGYEKKQTKSETAQDVSYVRNNLGKLKIDAKQYIDLLQQPICQFMELVVGKEVVAKVFQSARSELMRQDGGHQDITGFFEAAVPDPLVKKPTEASGSSSRPQPKTVVAPTSSSSSPSSSSSSSTKRQSQLAWTARRRTKPVTRVVDTNMTGELQATLESDENVPIVETDGEELIDE